MKGLQTIKKQGQRCSFCKLTDIDELKYGPLYKRGQLVAHYYCVLFSYRVNQNGADEEGILGFLIKDIRDELKRVKGIICDYCSKPNASVYCSHSQCRMKFHFPCGILNKSMHQFKGSFKSFCVKHRPRQKIPEEFMIEAEKTNPNCVICYEAVDHRNETDIIWANCCLKSWYHRECLQQLALNSGYLFKCAICNNKNKFKNWVEEYGIFVPKQDASWELEPNAFSELHNQHSRCDDPSCSCPYGKEYCSEGGSGEWEIILCKSCASQGTHLACAKVPTSNWECSVCKSVTSKLRKEKFRPKSLARDSAQSRSNQRSEIAENATSDSDDIATSSYLQRKSGPVKNSVTRRSKRGKKRKRTDDDHENFDLKKTAKSIENGQIQDKDPKSCSEKDCATETVEPSTHLHLQGQEAESDNEAVEIEEILPESSDDEEIIVDGPETSAGTSSAERETQQVRNEDKQIEVIDLTRPNWISSEEIISVVDAYRNAQLCDIRYRVKKEVYIISDDDESTDSEPEVVLQKCKLKKRSSASSESRAKSASVSVNKMDSKFGRYRSKPKKKNMQKICTSSSTKVLPGSVNSGADENSNNQTTNISNRKHRSTLLDKYFLIVLEKEGNRKHSERVKNIKSGSKRYKSLKWKKNKTGAHSAIVVSSDSDSSSAVEANNDDIEVIENISGGNSGSSS